MLCNILVFFTVIEFGFCLASHAGVRGYSSNRFQLIPTDSNFASAQQVSLKNMPVNSFVAK